MNKIFVAFIVIACLTFMVFGMIRSCNIGIPDKNGVLSPVHDTIYRERWNPDTSQKGKADLKPQLYTGYREPYKPDSNLRLQAINDSLLTLIRKGNKHDTIRIEVAKELIKDPKILKAKFTFDSVRLSFLDLKGFIHDEDYQIDIMNFGYVYTPSGGLQSYKHKTKFPKYYSRPKVHFDASSFIGLDPVNNNIHFMMDYSLMYKNLGISTRGDLSIGKEFYVHPIIGIKYELH